MNRELIGHFGVDAGICWIGDPCYIMHKGIDFPKEDLGKDWREFGNKLFGDSENFTSKEFPQGICVSTGYGDGQYPVYIEKNDEGRVMRVTIEFIPEISEDDEESGFWDEDEIDTDIDDDDYGDTDEDDDDYEPEYDDEDDD